MKSKLTTAFALLGVLAAGTAAAAINTQALQSHVESTIGANTSTLITPITADPTAADPTPQVIQLDANVSPATQAPAAKKPAKTATASASPKPANVATVTAPTQPTFENENEEEDEDDD